MTALDLAVIFLIFSLMGMTLVVMIRNDTRFWREMQTRNKLEQERNHILRSQYQFSVKRWDEQKEIKRGNDVSMRKTPLQELPNVPSKPMSYVWPPRSIDRNKN